MAGDAVAITGSISLATKSRTVASDSTVRATRSVRDVSSTVCCAYQPVNASPQSNIPTWTSHRPEPLRPFGATTTSREFGHNRCGWDGTFCVLFVPEVGDG